MDPNYQLFDWHRIFIGDTPANFLIEIVFRTVVMYSYTIFLLRVLGKRGMGQLSTLELAIIIGFGSAVGDPMLGVDVPILHGIVVITTITLLQIGLERYINTNKKIEVVMEGKPDEVINNGIIMAHKLKAINISQEDLFRALRLKDIEQLGEVRQAFFESSGHLSVFPQTPEKIKAGLSILPHEPDPKTFFLAGSIVLTDMTLSCTNCGNTGTVSAHTAIEVCTVCECDKFDISSKKSGNGQ